MFGKNKDKKEHKPCLDCQLKISEANERAADSEDKLLRAAADLDNYKKRQQKEMDMFKKVTLQSVLLDFLPVLDDIDMAISAAPKEVAEGLKFTKRKLLKRLEKHGVKPMSSLGKKFDPKHHEAVMTMEKEEHEEDTVIAVVEEGYLHGDFLLKPAKVAVSKKPQ